MELEFEVCPQVFDRIHIGGIWQPGHDGKPMLLCLANFIVFFATGGQALSCWNTISVMSSALRASINGKNISASMSI